MSPFPPGWPRRFASRLSLLDYVRGIADELASADEGLLLSLIGSMAYAGLEANA